MRFWKTLALALVALISFAGTGSALVTVNATTTVDSPLHVGDNFEVDILVSWDGGGALFGLFSSHVWDNTQLALVGANFPLSPRFETSPLLLRGGTYDPVLTRFGTISAGIVGDDITSSARTIQYGSLETLNPSTSAAMDQLVTRLTFQVVGGIGEGPVEINGAILLGDTGASGDDFTFGSEISILVVPEPGVGLMLGLGLAVLATPGRRGARMRGRD